MNCDSLLRLLEEIPLPRWTQQQQTSAREHCRSCDECRIQLAQQEALFVEFDRMMLPEPAAAFALEIGGEPRGNTSSAGGPRRMPWSPADVFSNAAVLFLCFGSVVQLFRESGFSPYWLADGSRLEAVVGLIYSAPALPVALTLVGLVYCLSSIPLNTKKR